MDVTRALRLRREPLAELAPSDLAAVAAAAPAQAAATLGYHCMSLGECTMETVLNTQLCRVG